MNNDAAKAANALLAEREDLRTLINELAQLALELSIFKHETMQHPAPFSGCMFFDCIRHREILSEAGIKIQ